MERALVGVASLVVAVVFAVAALAKARSVATTQTAAVDLGVPSALAGPVARMLPFVEGLAAVLLVGGLASRPVGRVGGAVALALLFAFSVAIARTLRAGRAPVCQCFGAMSARPIGPDALVRNVALSVLALVALVG